jgi:hypothetical protein
MQNVSMRTQIIANKQIQYDDNQLNEFEASEFKA